MSHIHKIYSRKETVEPKNKNKRSQSWTLCKIIHGQIILRTTENEHWQMFSLSREQERAKEKI